MTTDKQTKWLSWIMMATLLPYVVAQIPRLLGLTAGGSLAVAIAGVLSVLGVIAYCMYQVPFFSGFPPIHQSSEKISYLSLDLL